MSQIVNNDKLQLILTNFGLERIATAVEEPTTNLNITKIKLGSGDNGNYYTPDPSQTALKGDLGLEFYIYDKALLEDGLTVSFHTIIPDDIGGFDIREVGLYETFGGEERLFAISTQQPFVKPSSDDYYFINVDYYIFLKAQNFADVYDQITLDVEHAQVTDADLEELMRTFLFAQGNLINQIGNNSRIIGYNRATQLYEKIVENRNTFSYITAYKNYTSLLDFISSPNSIFSYWVFDYSRSNEAINSITDVSKNRFNLSTSIPANNLNRIYRGFTPMLKFDGSTSFSLSSQIPLNLYDYTTEADSNFTMIFSVEPLDNNTDRTLLAKSDYARGMHSFEVKELADESVQVKLFSDANNYLTFKTVQKSVPMGAHILLLQYDPPRKTMTFYINSTKYIVKGIQTGDNYKHISETTGYLYAFDCAPKYEIYAPQNSSSQPIEPLYYLDDNNNYVQYLGEDWTIDIVEGSNKIFYKENEASYVSFAGSTDTLYAWEPPSSVVVYDKVVYTKETSTPDGFASRPTLYNEKYEVYAGDDFGIERDDITGMYKIKFYLNDDTYDAVYDSDDNIQPKDLYLYRYQMTSETIYTNSPEYPTVLYEKQDDAYTTYSGDEWTLNNFRVYRLNQLATYNESKDVEVPMPDLASYIIGADGYPTEPINSNVGLISIIREGLSDEYARAIALNLCATLGRNPYIGGF